MKQRELTVSVHWEWPLQVLPAAAAQGTSGTPTPSRLFTRGLQRWILHRNQEQINQSELISNTERVWHGRRREVSLRRRNPALLPRRLAPTLARGLCGGREPSHTQPREARLALGDSGDSEQGRLARGPAQATPAGAWPPREGTGSADSRRARARRGFTWPRTRRCAAWCCPAGSAAASCTCRGPASCSRCG